MDQQFAEQILTKTRRDYDTIAASFSETRERSYDVQPFAANVKSSESVLDVGCGNGRLLDVLPVGVTYTGCDTSERMIALAEARHLYNGHLCTALQRCPLFVMGDILVLPFAPASFDHVFALAVLHHIPSDALRQQAVHELARVVKPGGRITITVWNLRSFYWMRRYRLWQLLFGLRPKGYDYGDCFIPWRRGVANPILRYVHALTYHALASALAAAGLRVFVASRGRNFTVVAEKK